jgi:hypothetical protein
LNQNLFQIIAPSTFLKKSINNDSIDSQCLFGEYFNILDTKGSWSFGTSIEDQYQGWVKSNSLGSYSNITHVVSSTRSFVFLNPDIKSKVLNYLPLRSKINVNKIENQWARIVIFRNNKYDHGYILNSQILPKNTIDLNWVKYAELLLFTPYRWGGRDSIGIDCSALLQLSKAFMGERLPRDTQQQFEYFDQLKQYTIYNDPFPKAFSRGNIIYWKGHIAIIIDEINLIHASAHHGKVVIETIEEALLRVNKKYFIVKEDNNY